MDNPSNWFAVDNWRDIPKQYQEKNVVHIKVNQSEVDVEHCDLTLVDKREGIFFAQGLITFLINLAEEDKTHLTLCGVKIEEERHQPNIQILNICLRDGKSSTDDTYV